MTVREMRSIRLSAINHTVASLSLQTFCNLKNDKKYDKKYNKKSELIV